MRYRESDVDKKLRDWFVNDYSRGSLRRIDLKTGSLRGLETFSLALDYPITALAGKNGAGKSTILAMACCAYHNKKSGFKLKKRKVTYFTFSDFFIQHTEEVPPQGIEIFYQFAHDRWSKTSSTPGGEGLGFQKRVKRKGGKWSDYAKRIKRDVVFLGIDRIVPHSERSQSKSYSKSFKEINTFGWENEVKNIVGYILGKKYDSLRYLEHSKYNLPIVEVEMVVYSGLNMGAGENALFEIFRILYTCGEGAFLVIDEIELGLHVDAQRRLIDKLKQVCFQKKTQILCTTHSREIFERLPPDARRYIEKVNNTTLLTEGIAPDFAMAKMGASEVKELDVLLEDGIAKAMLSFALPTELRARVRAISVGSSGALSRQLAATYARNKDQSMLAIFDGDQRLRKNSNRSHAKSMAELTDDGFDDWFSNHVAYLPGETWPEAWLVRKNIELVETLAESLAADSDWLKDKLEYGLQAGKHNEFFEIATHLGLAKEQAVQYFVMNIKDNEPSLFVDISSAIQEALDS